MRARSILVLGAVMVVAIAGAIATRDFGKHPYHPPLNEVWLNIVLDESSVEETVLWNPRTPATASPGAMGNARETVSAMLTPSPRSRITGTKSWAVNAMPPASSAVSPLPQPTRQAGRNSTRSIAWVLSVPCRGARSSEDASARATTNPSPLGCTW